MSLAFDYRASRSEIQFLEDALLFDMPRVQTDIGLVFGNAYHSAEAGMLAADLYRQGSFGSVIVSGGSKIKNSLYREFEIASKVMLETGVPQEALILEEHATHTGENILLSMPLGLRDAGSITLICARPHQRRVLMTARRYLGEKPTLTTASYLPAGMTQRQCLRDESFVRFMFSEYRKILHAQPSEQPLYVKEGYCVPIDIREEHRRAGSLPGLPQPPNMH